MSRTVVLVPRRSDGGWRDQLWAHCRPLWDARGWSIYEGHHGADEGKFNRSAAINRAAHAAGEWDQAFIIDGDVIAGDDQIHEALDRTRRWGVLTFAYAAYWTLTKRATTQLISRGRLDGDWHKQATFVAVNMSSSIECVPRTLWDEVGGFDETFDGWGWEDVAFMFACAAMRGGRFDRTAGEVWHLWHPHSTTDRNREVADANEARCQPYIDARYDREAMRAVLAMPGRPLDTPAVCDLPAANHAGVVTPQGFDVGPQKAELVNPSVITEDAR